MLLRPTSPVMLLRGICSEGPSFARFGIMTREAGSTTPCDTPAAPLQSQRTTAEGSPLPLKPFVYIGMFAMRCGGCVRRVDPGSDLLTHS